MHYIIMVIIIKRRILQSPMPNEHPAAFSLSGIFSGNFCTIHHHFEIFGTCGQMESAQYLNLMFCLAQPYFYELLTNLSKIFKQLQLIFVIVWSFTIMIQNNILKGNKIIITTWSSCSSDDC